MRELLLRGAVLLLRLRIRALRVGEPVVEVEDAELGDRQRKHGDAQRADKQREHRARALFVQIEVDARFLRAADRTAGRVRAGRFLLLLRDHASPPLMPSLTPPMARRYVHGSSVESCCESSSETGWSVSLVVSTMVRSIGSMPPPPPQM